MARYRFTARASNLPSLHLVQRGFLSTSLAPPLRYQRRKGLETLTQKVCGKKNTWLALRHVTEETRSVKTA
uniref:Uncharacterized protein n=1 Tax=Amphimedon queenslandica TaxID=400682 RepID=A0A1X7UK44_AMPQE